MPRWLRAISPPRPALRDAETVLYDMPAGRASSRFKVGYLLLPGFGRRSDGRLTITNQRIIYQTGQRDPTVMFLARHPTETTNAEIQLDDVSSIRTIPWIRRYWYGLSGMPWYTMVEVNTKDGQRLRFTSLVRSAWKDAMPQIQRLIDSTRNADAN
jgi:hypothetical protein